MKQVPARGTIQPSAPQAIDASSQGADVLTIVTSYMGLAMVLLKFGMLHEMQTYVMGFKGYLLYVVGIPSALGVLLAGGLRRGMAGRPAYYWLGFASWMAVCVAFSSWKWNSMTLTRYYFRDNLLMLFVIAGLIITWRQCLLMVKVIAAAAMINVLTGRIFAKAAAGRLSLEFGSVSNANDFAAHLLLTLPFLMLMMSLSKSTVVRVISFFAVSYGVLVIFKSGSRGAIVALALDIIFVFLMGNTKQRIALTCIIPVGLMAIMALIPSGILTRLHSFSASEQGASSEALESSDLREKLLKKALEYSLENPIVGVGPGQFINYEGTHNIVWGTHGMFHATHNSFVQAFAEMGFPGGILQLAGFVSSFLLLYRTHRTARGRPECEDIRNVTFCAMLGLLGFTVAITFLNFTFSFYGPAMGGVAISLWRAANVEFKRRVPPPPPPPLFGRSTVLATASAARAAV